MMKARHIVSCIKRVVSMVLAVVFMVSSVAPVASMQSNKPLKEMSDLFQSLMPVHVTRNGVTPAVYAREVLAKGTDTVAVQVAREFYSAIFVNVLAFYAGSTTGAESKAWGTLRDYVAQYIMNNDFLQNKVAGAVLAKVNAWSVTFDKDGGVTGADKAELYQFVQEFPMLLHVIVDGDASRLRPEQLKLIEISAQNIVAHKSESAKPAASTAPTVAPGVAAPVAMPGMPQAPALSAGPGMMPGVMPQMSLAKKKTFFQRFERLIKIGGSVSLIAAIGIALWIWTNRDESESKASNIFNFMVGRAVQEANPGVLARLKKDASFFERHFVLKNMAKMFGLDEKGMSREYKLREMRNKTTRLTKEISAMLDGLATRTEFNHVSRIFDGLEALEKKRKPQEIRKAALRALGKDDSRLNAFFAKFSRSEKLKDLIREIRDEEPADVVSDLQKAATEQVRGFVAKASKAGWQSITLDQTQLRKVFTKELTDRGVKKADASRLAKGLERQYVEQANVQLEEANKKAEALREANKKQAEYLECLNGIARKINEGTEVLSATERKIAGLDKDKGYKGLAAMLRRAGELDNAPRKSNGELNYPRLIVRIAQVTGTDLRAIDEKATPLIEGGHVADVKLEQPEDYPVDKHEDQIGSYDAQWTGCLARQSSTVLHSAEPQSRTESKLGFLKGWWSRLTRKKHKDELSQQRVAALWRDANKPEKTETAMQTDVSAPAAVEESDVETAGSDDTSTDTDNGAGVMQRRGDLSQEPARVVGSDGQRVRGQRAKRRSAAQRRTPVVPLLSAEESD